MPNIPANDTSARVVPGIQTFCEWLVRLAGRIATCVESAEMVVDHIATHGRIPVSVAEDIALTQDLQARGEADPGGATNSDAASAQMVRLGIPNTHLHQSAQGWDWVGMIKAGINRGVASVYGFNQAHLTFDDWTGQWTNQGVYGHGVAIVGYDDRGAIVADPNTQQAADGNFVHYTWQRLLDAASGDPDIITPEGSTVGIPSGWTDDGTTLRAPDGTPVVHGFRDWVLSHPWDADNWPLGPEAGRNPLEPNNPVMGGGTRQVFRGVNGTALLYWRAAKTSPTDPFPVGVFIGWAGGQLLHDEAELAKPVPAPAPAHTLIANGQPVSAPFSFTVEYK